MDAIFDAVLLASQVDHIDPVCRVRAWIWRMASAAVIASCSLSVVAIGQTAPPPVLGSTVIGAGIPTGPSPDAKGNLYSLDVYYFEADGSLGKATVEVPNIPVTQGLPNPTAAQIAAARTAKAKAIADAINKAQLNGVKAAVNGADPTQITVDGVRQSIGTYKFPKPGTPGTYLGAPITRTPGNRVTGELGNTQFNFKQGGGGSGGSSGSMYQGSIGGLGSGAVASGFDASGFQSLIGFGFIDYSPSVPISYTESFSPSPGMSEIDALGMLADLFNRDYAPSGYTASFDPNIDALAIDQFLPPQAALWSSDSDTSLDLMTQLIAIPEPSPAGLIAVGGLFAWLFSRQRSVRS